MYDPSQMMRQQAGTAQRAYGSPAGAQPSAAAAFAPRPMPTQPSAQQRLQAGGTPGSPAMMQRAQQAQQMQQYRAAPQGGQQSMWGGPQSMGQMQQGYGQQMNAQGGMGQTNEAARLGYMKQQAQAHLNGTRNQQMNAQGGRCPTCGK